MAYQTPKTYEQLKVKLNILTETKIIQHIHKKNVRRSLYAWAQTGGLVQRPTMPLKPRHSGPFNLIWQDVSDSITIDLLVHK